MSDRSYPYLTEKFMPSKRNDPMPKNTIQLAIIVLVGAVVTVSIALYFGAASIGPRPSNRLPDLGQTHMKRRLVSSKDKATSSTDGSATAGRP